MSIYQGDQNKEKLFHFFLELIDTYEHAIGDLEKRLKKENNKPPSSIYEPVVNRLYIEWLLEFLKKNRTDLLEAEKKIKSIDKKFSSIRETWKNEYINQMLELFRENIKIYNPEDALLDSDLFELNIRIRNHIEAMKIELELLSNIEYEINEIKQKDGIFIGIIPETIHRKTYLPNDLPYSPPDIWWRHLVEKYGEPAD